MTDEWTNHQYHPDRLPKSPDMDVVLFLAAVIGLTAFGGAVAGFVGAFTLHWLGG